MAFGPNSAPVPNKVRTDAVRLMLAYMEEDREAYRLVLEPYRETFQGAVDLMFAFQHLAAVYCELLCERVGMEPRELVLGGMEMAEELGLDLGSDR